MKLLTLTLRNFQGVKDFTLDTQGKDVTVYGDNGAGKTTLASAWSWLLFDKDSLNRKDFEIKTLTPEGEAIHGLEHEVEATIDLDGEQLTLKKVYSEKWTKTRGSAQATFSGHTTNHYIDGVPVSKRTYQDKIAEIADENIFRLLTDPRAFNENLHWADRRKVLLQVCGDVTDADVIASDPSLKDLPGILGKKSLEDHKAIVKEQRVRVNRDLQQIPTRVSEVQRGLPDISQLNPGALAGDIAALRHLREAKQAEKLRIEQGGEVAEKTKALREIEAKMFEVEGIHRREQAERTMESRNRLYAARSARKELELDIHGLEDKIETWTAAKLHQQEIMSKLRRDYAKVDAETFGLDLSNICPTCGQTIPEDQMRGTYEKAIESLNLDKAQRLEAITAEGKEHRDKAEGIREQIAEMQDQLVKSRAILSDLLEQEKKLQAEVDSKPPVPVEQNREYIELLNHRGALEQVIDNLKEDSQDALKTLQDEIDAHAVVIKALEREQMKLETHAQAQARIEELKAEERRLSKEYEALERQQYLCDEFTRAKVRMLDEKINSRFKLARFKLFDEQVNGGISECCETLYDGVPWGGGLNNGSQINVGIDIINTLAEHYGFSAPIFADNAESVTQIIPTPAQLIRLVKPDIEHIAKAIVDGMGIEDEAEHKAAMEQKIQELRQEYSKLRVEVEA